MRLVVALVLVLSLVSASARAEELVPDPPRVRWWFGLGIGSVRRHAAEGIYQSFTTTGQLGIYLTPHFALVGASDLEPDSDVYGHATLRLAVRWAPFEYGPPYTNQRLATGGSQYVQIDAGLDETTNPSDPNQSRDGALLGAWYGVAPLHGRDYALSMSAGVRFTRHPGELQHAYLVALTAELY
jgi:hypothetical protein